uniref:Uncharacterized protein n=1 Tax=Schistosoma haematobium TaxID=6185 RepID=A0A095ASU4_SCHHA
MSDVDDDKCDVSINSMSSNQLSTSRLRLGNALLRMKNLEKRLELGRQLKMLDLQEEIDMAELECKFIEDDNQLRVDKCGINAKVKRYLDCDNGCNNHSRKVFNISKSDWVDELKDTLHTMVNNMVLPKIDMMYFDGQPSQHHRFISQFTSVIESKLSDKGQLLSYLLYYCIGKARMAIEACIPSLVSQGIPVWRSLLATVQNLREAANLVPKMSTPKLTYALKVTSSLQQKITDTVASRLPQEKSTEQPGDSNRQQIHLDSMLSQGGFPEATLITSDSDQKSETRDVEETYVVHNEDVPVVVSKLNTTT